MVSFISSVSNNSTSLISYFLFFISYFLFSYFCQQCVQQHRLLNGALCSKFHLKFLISPLPKKLQSDLFYLWPTSFSLPLWICTNQFFYTLLTKTFYKSAKVPWWHQLTTYGRYREAQNKFISQKFFERKALKIQSLSTRPEFFMAFFSVLPC